MRGNRPLSQGAIFSQPVANPGAGVPLDIIAQNSQVWRLHGIVVVLTTDATVANRQVYLQYTNGITFGARILFTFVQTASLPISYNFLSWLRGPEFNILGRIHMSLGGGVLIDGAEYIRISVDNFQAGDAFTGCIVSGERWLSD